jgi:hypothetical protein
MEKCISSNEIVTIRKRMNNQEYGVFDQLVLEMEASIEPSRTLVEVRASTNEVGLIPLNDGSEGFQPAYEMFGFVVVIGLASADPLPRFTMV